MHRGGPSSGRVSQVEKVFGTSDMIFATSDIGIGSLAGSWRRAAGKGKLAVAGLLSLEKSLFAPLAYSLPQSPEHWNNNLSFQTSDSMATGEKRSNLRMLDEAQPQKQAGFRHGFSCLDQIQTVSKVKEVRREYSLPPPHIHWKGRNRSLFEKYHNEAMKQKRCKGTEQSREENRNANKQKEDTIHEERLLRERRSTT
ncbi:hypothetical protein RB195_014144 [Necator americanus]|uniref:Uncharacterized protein n=1 Tax=Necator americanus TaxID=51031 RepID=A0ABR1E002_NECAM